jgi:NAD(P)-dependent dehydrogenase (short-subunit alcohol dehydrogenase family)
LYFHVDTVNKEKGMAMKTFMVTGSTRGLGLEIARLLAKRSQTQVIMAVRDLKKGQEIARQLGENATAVQLDLSSLADVARFARDWKIKLDGLVNNAGVQFSTRESFSPDHFEETIAVNHLAAFLLTMDLEDHLVGSRVLFIGSGTHNPKRARAFGFRGAQFTSVQELSAGKSSSDNIFQRNKDRYATSKFLNMVTAVELARRNKPYLSFALDPGLMPGTGLARTQNSPMEQFLWKRVMPAIARFVLDGSSPKRSAAAAAWILTEEELPYPNGTIFSFNKKPNKYVWEEMVRNPRVGAEVYEQSLEILKNFRK